MKNFNEVELMKIGKYYFSRFFCLFGNLLYLFIFNLVPGRQASL